MTNRSPNASTRFGVALIAPVEPAALDALYRCARESIGPAEGGHPYRASGRTVPGYRLFFSRTPGRIDVWRELEPRRTVVVGRHTACDVHLPYSDDLSLRHLLVSCVVLDDGTSALRVIDLQTFPRFALMDGTPRSSIMVTGPIAFGVAGYAVVALPLGVDPVHLPNELPLPLVVQAQGPPRRTMAPFQHSHVTLLPGLSEIDEGRVLASAQMPKPGALRITLRRYDYGATVDLGADELATGVLVGRAHKCCDALRRALTEGVSRAHLLLIREEGFTVAHDLCSVQRTFAQGTPARRAVLGARGGSLWLASGMNAVELVWHAQV